MFALPGGVAAASDRALCGATRYNDLIDVDSARARRKRAALERQLDLGAKLFPILESNTFRGTLEISVVW